MSLWLTGQYPAVAETLPTPVDINGVRFWSSPDHTQVVFDASGPVWHKILILKNPDRLVVDLLGGRTESLWTEGQAGGFVKDVHTGITKEGLSLITLDLKQVVYPGSFNLKPKWHYGHRLVIDLSAKEETLNSNKIRVANIDMDVNAYYNPGWQGAYRLVIDQSPREETANIFRVANVDREAGAYTMSRAVNDAMIGGMVGGLLGWLVAVIRSRACQI